VVVRCDPGKQNSLSCAVHVTVQQSIVRGQLATFQARQALQASHSHPGQYKTPDHLHQHPLVYHSSYQSSTKHTSSVYQLSIAAMDMLRSLT